MNYFSCTSYEMSSKMILIFFFVFGTKITALFMCRSKIKLLNGTSISVKNYFVSEKFDYFPSVFRFSFPRKYRKYREKSLSLSFFGCLFIWPRNDSYEMTKTRSLIDRFTLLRRTISKQTKTDENFMENDFPFFLHSVPSFIAIGCDESSHSSKPLFDATHYAFCVFVLGV